MKLTHIPLLAGTLASAFSFNTFAGDLVSVANNIMSISQ